MEKNQLWATRDGRKPPPKRRLNGAPKAPLLCVSPPIRKLTHSNWFPICEFQPGFRYVRELSVPADILPGTVVGLLALVELYA